MKARGASRRVGEAAKEGRGQARGRHSERGIRATPAIQRVSGHAAKERRHIVGALLCCRREIKGRRERGARERHHCLCPPHLLERFCLPLTMLLSRGSCQVWGCGRRGQRWRFERFCAAHAQRATQVADARTPPCARYSPRRQPSPLSARARSGQPAVHRLRWYSANILSPPDAIFVVGEAPRRSLPERGKVLNEAAEIRAMREQYGTELVRACRAPIAHAARGRSMAMSPDPRREGTAARLVTAASTLTALYVLYVYRKTGPEGQHKREMKDERQRARDERRPVAEARSYVGTPARAMPPRPGTPPAQAPAGDAIREWEW